MKRIRCDNYVEWFGFQAYAREHIETPGLVRR